MTQQNTDFGKVADDLRRAATSFAILTSSASVFGKSLTAFREFNRQMVLTNAIAGGTEAQLKQMTEAARQFSLITTTSAVEAGRALQQLAQAGFTAEESLQGMVGVLLLAQATLTDVAVASDVLSSNIRAFGLETTDTVRVANVFTAAITGSLATMDKLAFAMRQVAPVAELAGLSIEETTAALGVLFDVGLRGEQAGTALRNVIIRLVRPLGAAKDLLVEAGIATHTATGEFRNLADILLDIGNSNLTNADLARIFETEALAGVKALINSLQTLEENGVNVYENLKDAITGTNRAVELTARNLSTFDGAMLLFRNRVEDVGRTIGESIAPSIEFITDKVSLMIDAFNALSPAARKLIAASAAIGAALIGLLATLNAFILVLRGPLLVFLGRVAAGFGSAAASVAGFTLSLSGLTTSAIGAVASLGRMVPAVAALGGISALAGSVAAFATGLGLIATVGYGAYKTLDFLTVSQQEYNDAIERTNDTFAAARVDADTLADSIISQEAIDEVRYRLSFLQKEIAIAGEGLNLANYAHIKTGQIKAEQSALVDAQKLLESNFEQVISIFRMEREFNRQIEHLDSLDNGFVYNLINSRTINRKRAQLAALVDELTDEQRAQLAVLRRVSKETAINDEQLTEALRQMADEQRKGLQQFLFAFKDGDASLGRDLVQAEAVIRASGILNATGTITQIIDDIIKSNDAPTVDNIARRLLDRAGISQTEIEDLLQERVRKQTAAFLSAIQSLTTDIQTDSEKLRIALLKHELDRADNVTEAVRLAQEAGIAELEADLQKLADDLRGKMDNVLVDYNVDTFEGIKDVLRNAATAAGFTADDVPGFAEAISGEAFIQSLRERIDESTTPEEAKTIIDEQRQMYAKLVESYVNAVADAVGLTEEQRNALIDAARATQTNIDLAVLTGLGDLTGLIDSAISKAEQAQERIKRDKDRAARAASGAANQSLLDARKVEDAFARIATQMRDAQESYYDAVRGLSPAIRKSLALDLDIQGIRAEAEDQIRRLKRELSDLTENFTGSPDRLVELQNQYARLIDMIERTTEAEVSGAQSFESMMDRRRDALDLFIRDMQDMAFKSQDVFSQVGAGISIAFAEYQKDLVSLVDITKDATTDFINSVSSLIGDFIFDTENAWESFRKSILRISRTALEGFTATLLQQVMSQVTSSAFGGGLFSGLFGRSFADGGEVRGPGTGTSDSIIARVSNGEFIVAAEQAKKYKPLLQAINSGVDPAGISRAIESVLYKSSRLRIPAYADGGFVRSSSYIIPPISSRAVAIDNTRQTRTVSNTGGSPVNITFNITTPDAQSFVRSKAQIAAEFQRALGVARRVI